MNQQNNPARIRTKRLLNHYFSVAFKAAGARWDNDNVAEVECMVDDLIQAAVDQMKADVPEEEQAGKGYADWHGRKSTTRSQSIPTCDKVDPELGW